MQVGLLDFWQGGVETGEDMSVLSSLSEGLKRKKLKEGVAV